MKARYNRISTGNQNIARQLVRQNPDEVLYNDVVSGSVQFKDRANGQKLINDIEQGKINFVVVSSIDRLGRNLQDIINTIEYFKLKNVIIRVDDLGIESMLNGRYNELFGLLVAVVGSLAQNERTNLLSRQAEGVAIAKANGVYKGRVLGSADSVETILNKHKEVVKFLKQGNSLRNTAKLANVSVPTVQKVKKLIQL